VLVPRRTDGGLRLWRCQERIYHHTPPKKMVEVGKKNTILKLKKCKHYLIAFELLLVVIVS
jgi:hypothetical protein